MRKICPNCKIEFETKINRKKFCDRPCYYKFNYLRLKAINDNKAKLKRENPQYPKYITEKGEEIQLDFDPIKDWNKFLEIKEKNP